MSKKNQLPDAEDYSGRAVQKAVLSEAVQHPTTLLPAAAAVLSGAYMGLINFGDTPLKLALGAAFLAVGSWVFHYFIRGEKYAEEYIQKLNAKRLAAKEDSFEQLLRACARSGFHEGAKEARELREAYRKLTGLLEEKGSGESRAARFAVLAQECYDEGIAILGKAAANNAVLRDMREHELQNELRGWEHQARVLAPRLNDPKMKERHDALQKRMESHRRRLDLCKNRRLAVDRLLAESEELEAALESAYLEAVDLFGHQGRVAVSDPASRLERAVSAARRVEAKLAELERPEDEKEDEIYRQAARQD